MADRGVALLTDSLLPVAQAQQVKAMMEGSVGRVRRAAEPVGVAAEPVR